MEEKQTKQRLRRRLIPIWLRLLLVLCFITMSALAGAMVGYGVLGDGNPFEALKPATWQHMIDLIEKQ
ncbi:DNA-directed RNA polymerase subunit beta [Anoxybacillus sp. ST4]|uniref:DNA-directed RNA polymerase subunit beta n=1 Tax=Anoxybacillus sp. ST4 TaxID=2864181 RepID=UPI001C643F10|nr:DNA-directed RNA polymerase subunit beta [Anoxybacillus sp. ST4]MBW7650411.1 DNA-directed RNA polymerase subunit beta [Anoxybacillus sp. ST4]